VKFIELKPGKSILNRDILAYKSEVNASKYFYVLGAVHGDEVEGAHLAAKLLEWAKENSELNLPIIFVPIVNIDGFVNNTRVNANGVDLNRNLPSSKWQAQFTEAKYNPGTSPLSEPENKFLISLFDQYPPRFILSFHSWYPVLNYNGKCKEVAEYLQKFNQYPIEADFENHPTPGSLGEYGPQHYSCPVLTFECPLITEGHTLEGIWEINKEGLTSLFSSGFVENFKN